MVQLFGKRGGGVSDTFIELAVVVTEKPGITYVARCNGSSSSCTHSATVAASRAALAVLRKSGKLSGKPDERRLSLLRRVKDGYRTTWAARYDLGSEVAA